MHLRMPLARTPDTVAPWPRRRPPRTPAVYSPNLPGPRPGPSDSEALRLNAKFLRNGIVMLVLVAGTIALLYTWVTSTTPANTVGYSEFLNKVAAGEVAEGRPGR